MTQILTIFRLRALFLCASIWLWSVQMLCAQTGDAGDIACPFVEQLVLPGQTPHYTEQAVRMYPEATWVNGAQKVASSWSESIHQLQFDPGWCIAARPDTSFVYALEHLTHSDGSEGHMLVVYERVGTAFLRNMEFFAWEDKGVADLPAIDLARDQWVRLCNLHNAAELVHSMYTQDAMYYNHKPVIQGREAITAEYAYMNNLEYSLALEPLIVQSVSATMALEIGQCSGSYGGKYLLVWKRNADGQWRVLMDSNI